MNCPTEPQRRSDQTRRQIMAAFTRLVFAHGFENVSVKKVVDEARVARSTFYEHFADKEDVLRACMTFLFSVIADCIVEDEQPPTLTKVLDHLWSNRRLTDGVFSGHARAILSRNQADLVELRLRSMVRQSPEPQMRLIATGIAESQLAMLESWMRGRAYCPLAQLADSLHRTSRGAAKAALSQ